MNFFRNFCYICLKNEQVLQRLPESSSRNVTYYTKLTSLIPEMVFPELDEHGMICVKCCVNLDDAYRFRDQCLKNKQLIIIRMSQLRSTTKIESNELDLVKYVRNDSEHLHEEKEELQSEDGHEFETEIEPFQDSNDSNIPLIINNLKVELQEHENAEVPVIPEEIPFQVTSGNKCEQDNSSSAMLKEEFIIKYEESENIHFGDNNRNTTVYNDPSLDKTNKTLPKPSRIKPETQKIFKCDDCEKIYHKHSHLKEHQRIHTGVRPFKCDQCDKAFAQSSTLVKHKTTHSAEKPFICEICHKSFSLMGTLVAHKRRHTDNRPVKCDQCGKGFLDNSDLIRHTRIHTGERPYSCDLCGKAYKQMADLMRHKLRHSGVKPFICDQCGKAYLTGFELGIHKRDHSGEKPFICDICGKAFPSKGRLDQHKRTHTSEKTFACDECDVVCSAKSHLVKHKRLHTGIKPFICEVCGKAFAVRNTLKMHRRIHTGERPHECHLCDKAFVCSSHLLRHKRKHHPDLLLCQNVHM